jgi:8-oxo-dGTP pyrophosphatase MutT (NUDIX family)
LTIFSSLADIEARLRAGLAAALPGADAQMRLSPRPARADWRPGRFPAEARRAAGLILLYPAAGSGGPALPLTLRAGGLRHGGQISLPGGVIDPGESIEAAALREAHEEIGVAPPAVEPLGGLTPVHIAVSGFVLHPIVGLARERPAFRPAVQEVDAILEVPLGDLLDASRLRRGTLLRDGLEIEYPYFDLLGHHVWGATAMVLAEFSWLLGVQPAPWPRHEDPLR